MAAVYQVFEATTTISDPHSRPDSALVPPSDTRAPSVNHSTFVVGRAGLRKGEVQSAESDFYWRVFLGDLNCSFAVSHSRRQSRPQLPKHLNSFIPPPQSGQTWLSKPDNVSREDSFATVNLVVLIFVSSDRARMPLSRERVEDWSHERGSLLV
jgi:hypothetical protein